MAEKRTTSEYKRATKIAQKDGRPSPQVYELLERAAKKNDPDAEYALATWYLHGNELVSANKRTAISMLRKATQAGVSAAAFDLAVCYERGEGVKKSEERAFSLFVQAALAGDIQAYYEVGRMYYYGIGTVRNRALAKTWLQKASKLGYRE